MSDYWRETFSYFGLLRKTGKVKKVFSPEYFSFGEDREGRKRQGKSHRRLVLSNLLKK